MLMCPNVKIVFGMRGMYSILRYGVILYDDRGVFIVNDTTTERDE